MRIGNIELSHGLVLAPMAGVTDLAMRTVCAENGAEYAVTEMVSAKALVYEQRSSASAPARTAALCRVDATELIPVAVQIFGSEPEIMAEAARLISGGSYRAFSGRTADAIDINMGCPVKKVAGNGEGAALMKDPDLIYRITAACCRASALPVTVKIRAGWDADSINAPECAAAAESAGAAAVCVHARTREQFYRPGIIMDVIGKTKAAVRIPVIGNGDVTTPESAAAMIRSTGCDGVAVARGALGNPMLFSAIRDLIEGREPLSPSPDHLLRTALKQLRIAVSEKGPRRGLAETKYALSHYVTGLPGAAQARFRIMSSIEPAEAEAALSDFFQGIESN